MRTANCKRLFRVAGSILAALCLLFLKSEARSYTYTSPVDLSTIPSDATELNFYNFPLITILSTTFQDLPRSCCWKMQFSRTETTLLEPYAFSAMSFLTELSIQSSKLSVLRQGSFDGLTSLTRLDLTFNNQLLELEPFLFRGLNRLHTIRLNNNQLSELDPQLFTGLTSLQYLNLHDNQLLQLDGSLFAGLTNLRDLRLHNNQLTRLNSSTFDGFSSLKNLPQLDLGNNNISEIDPSAFDGLTSLTHLFLDNNQISYLPPSVFDNLPSLDTLNLENNKISELPPGLFPKLTLLKRIYLENNNLYTLEWNVFSRSQMFIRTGKDI